jgi:hypothetical protein
LLSAQPPKISVLSHTSQAPWTLNFLSIAKPEESEDSVLSSLIRLANALKRYPFANNNQLKCTDVKFWYLKVKQERQALAQVDEVV